MLFMEKQCVTNIKIVCDVHLRKKHLQSHFFSYKMRVSYGGWVAQLVEQRIENPRVGGSIPSPATSRLSRVVFTARDFLFFFPRLIFYFFQNLGCAKTALTLS